MRQFSRGFLPLVLLGSLFGRPLPLLAQIDSLSFIPPDDHVGEPANVGGGGSRTGFCLRDKQNQPPLTILAPQLPKISATANVRQRGGLTIASTPYLFVYLPKTQAKTGDFLLLEHLENGETREVYYREFPLPEESGIIRLSMPIALEEGKIYEWQFSLVCPHTDANVNSEPQRLRRYNPQERTPTAPVFVGAIELISLPEELTVQMQNPSWEKPPQFYGQMGLGYGFDNPQIPSNDTEFSINPVVAGQIERISLSEELAMQLKDASLETQIELYGQAGLWYDFFALLAENLPRTPHLQRTWQTVLRHNIDSDRSISHAPFIPCCSLTSEQE